MLDPDDVIEYMQSLGSTGIRYSDINAQVRGTCPFHGGNNPTAFVVRLDSGNEMCYVCGHTGKASVKNQSVSGVVERVERIYEDLSEMAELMVEDMALDYSHGNLRTRNQDTLKKCGAGVATNGVERGRTIFVYRDSDGKVHGFKSRVQRDFRVDNYYRISSVFYMEHLWTKHYPIVIVEGEWDAIRLYDIGVRNVFALGGSSMSAARIDNIVEKTGNVYLMLDNDKAGRDATADIADRLSGLVNVYDLPYKYKDPEGLVGKADFWRSYQQAVRL